VELNSKEERGFYRWNSSSFWICIHHKKRTSIHHKKYWSQAHWCTHHKILITARKKKRSLDLSMKISLIIYTCENNTHHTASFPHKGSMMRQVFHEGYSAWSSIQHYLSFLHHKNIFYLSWRRQFPTWRRHRLLWHCCPHTPFHPCGDIHVVVTSYHVVTSFLVDPLLVDRRFFVEGVVVFHCRGSPTRLIESFTEPWHPFKWSFIAVETVSLVIRRGNSSWIQFERVLERFLSIQTTNDDHHRWPSSIAFGASWSHWWLRYSQAAEFQIVWNLNWYHRFRIRIKTCGSNWFFRKKDAVY